MQEGPSAEIDYNMFIKSFDFFFSFFFSNSMLRASHHTSYSVHEFNENKFVRGALRVVLLLDV